MDRLSTGIIIALATFALSGGMMRDVIAAEAAPAPQQGQTIKAPVPVVNGLRSGRVLSLLLTLEALRAAPALLATPNV
jgi:hypothetical protein